METEQDKIKKDIDNALDAGIGPKISRFALACLSGVPFVGGVFGASAGAWSESEQKRFNSIFASWVKLQEDEVKEIGKTLIEVMIRLDMNNKEIEDRIKSPEYLKLVKKCFRDWSAAESEEKRVLIRNLLANAASTKVCGDDVIRLFIEWIDRYSEAHFRILKVIYTNIGFTRREIWEKVNAQEVKENSAEADLFRLLIHDLSLGRVIRQHRETDYDGSFLKERPAGRRKGYSDRHMTSAFDDKKQYEITELGRWFVHYTMNEIVPKISYNESRTNV